MIIEYLGLSLYIKRQSVKQFCNNCGAAEVTEAMHIGRNRNF